MNKNKLRKNLCPKDNCNGYLQASITEDDVNVMVCSECDICIDGGDFEIMKLEIKDEKIIDEIEKNLSELNNL